MFNAFQWNMCNIALILLLKCDVTKFRILPPSHNATLRRPPSPPLRCDVIYGCPLTYLLTLQSNSLPMYLCTNLLVHFSLNLLPTNQFIFLIYPPIFFHSFRAYLPIYHSSLLTYLPAYQPIYLLTYLLTYPSAY